METRADLQTIEVRLLVEGIYRYYGYDFRDYALSTMKRLIARRCAKEGLSSISALQEKILHDSKCLDRFLLDLSIGTTSLFRDPSFYKTFRKKIVPLLQTYPFVRIWNAGCSTGEEVYSMAILLREEGLYDRTKIYATDFNVAVLKSAEDHSFPVDKIEEYSENYLHAGGKFALDQYYSRNHTKVLFDPSLLSNVTFLQHNLVTDQSFLEFNVALCRNVLIYFNRGLQNRVHDLLFRSLCRLGILCLGKKESLNFTSHESDYKELDTVHKIYR
ncbi:MAG TPA: CheR family methyltransferase, partial [Acidobacteriota bacterium]|nr:CheR family methyltransferase [Acidobacteriota bacterium]